MNKAELIDAIAKKTSFAKKDARIFLNAFVEVTSTILSKGDRLTLVGFGAFSVIKKSARVARNPITGASLKVPAKKVVRFKPGLELRGKVK
jgi:DNA-binding protein HU-beta